MKKFKIGITCYPSIGGSGIIATELGKALAKKGHEIHFITYEKPFKLSTHVKNVFFHQVKVSDYPLFKYPDYTLPLAVKMTEVAEKYNLDLLHVHYAVPHATAALFARAMSAECRMCAPKVITTLHGTDITLLATDKNLRPAIQFSIDLSDGVTAVSHSLARDTKKILKISRPIEVIHNFYTPEKKLKPAQIVRRDLKILSDDFVLIHMSNLRGVKRIEDTLKAVALVPKNIKIKLLILSAGDFKPYQKLVKKLKIANRIRVCVDVRQIGNYINAADAGIYTSQTESFGMGILETMAYGKPVLATKAGGIPEVIEDGHNGFLYKVGDIKGFAKGISQLAQNKDLSKKMGLKALLKTRESFATEKIVAFYENYYQKVLGKPHNHHRQKR